MMSIVLFAIIGTTIKAGVAYWICFGLFSAFKIIGWIVDAFNPKN